MRSRVSVLVSPLVWVHSLALSLALFLALAMVWPRLALAELHEAPADIESTAEAPEKADVTETSQTTETGAATGAATEALEVVATLRGQASFYAKGFHGRRTASGERYDAQGLTAAHRSLPFGTWVRVQSLQSGREVSVRINDRGPFVRGRVIDLSRAAAEALGMLSDGTHAVKVQVLGSPPP